MNLRELLLDVLLVTVVFLAVCLIVNTATRPRLTHAIYIASVSRVELVDRASWLVSYTLDGQAQSIEVADLEGEPERFISSLRDLGEVR